MDGDDFSRATQLGRTAVDALWDSISSDVPLDGFSTVQLIDRFVGHADGIPSLPRILSVLAELATEPLFAHSRTDEAIDRVNDAARGPLRTGSNHTARGNHSARDAAAALAARAGDRTRGRSAHLAITRGGSRRRIQRTPRDPMR